MITAIGNPVYDYIKTQKVNTEHRVLSGCSTNAALALSKMNEPVRLVGAVGDDYKPRFLEVHVGEPALDSAVVRVELEAAAQLP